jgi:hypothetical protein
MKITCELLRNGSFSKKGLFRYKENTFYIKECKQCGEVFLGTKRSNYCNRKCSMIGNYMSKETKEKISVKLKGNKNAKGSIRSKEYIDKQKIIQSGKRLSDITKLKISNSIKGRNHPRWDGGYNSNNIPKYDLYAPQLEWCEKVRRSLNDKNILEVKCAYCGKWFTPGLGSVSRRISSLDNKMRGENRFYCSNGCKQECPIYGQILYPKGFKQATSREVQPELRQMVFKRDNHTCLKCGSTESLHCHHIEGINYEPLESADIDSCVTVCKKCHREIHKQPDCGYHDMKC